MIDRRQWLAGVAALGAFGAGGTAWAQQGQGFGGLEAAFRRIEQARGGRLGVAVLDTGRGRQASHRGDERFPLTSTFKLLAAGAVLARADAGQSRLDRTIRFTREDLVTYSPVTEKHVGAGMTLEALCAATMTTSDNTAGNLLLAELGGPAGLTAWLRGLGDGVTRLDRTEPTLNEGRPGDARDTTSPNAMVATLRRLAVGDVLKPASRALLLRWLRENKTGDKRLRARLPPGWTAGEKTGTGNFNTSNDVGLLWPPGGAAPVLVAAYLTEGPADGAVREAALADVGAAVAAAWG